MTRASAVAVAPMQGEHERDEPHHGSPPKIGSFSADAASNSPSSGCQSGCSAPQAR